MSKEQRLGYKTFFVFFLQKSFLFWILLLILLASTILSLTSFAKRFSAPLQMFSSYNLLLTVAVLLTTCLVSWVQYNTYNITLDENALIIKKGFLNRQEIAIPYRQIQNVNIEQSVVDQLLGVSQLIILTTGESFDDTNKASAKLLPPLDKTLAQQLRQKLLERTALGRDLS